MPIIKAVNCSVEAMNDYNEYSMRKVYSWEKQYWLFYYICIYWFCTFTQACK